VGKIGTNTGGAENMFLDKDVMERPAWHNIAYGVHTELLHTLWEWTREELITEELENLFLCEHEIEGSVWRIAANGSHTEVLHKLWEWAS